jgi:hypothetical protein
LDHCAAGIPHFEDLEDGEEIPQAASDIQYFCGGVA